MFESSTFVAQAIGFVALAFGMGGYLFECDRRLKLAIATASVLLGLHFYLLGALTGAVSAALVGVRFFVAAHTSNKWVGIAFIVLHTGLGLAVFREATDILPIIATVNGTIAVFFLKGIPMRLSLLATTFLWLMHNAIQGSYGGSLLESFYVCTNLWTLWRMATRRSARYMKSPSEF